MQITITGTKGEGKTILGILLLEKLKELEYPVELEDGKITTKNYKNYCPSLCLECVKRNSAGRNVKIVVKN